MNMPTMHEVPTWCAYDAGRGDAEGAEWAIESGTTPPFHPRDAERLARNPWISILTLLGERRDSEG